MTRKLLSLLVMVSVGTLVANAHACDKNKSAEKTAAGKPCSEGCSGNCDPANCPHCSKKAELTSADGRSEAAGKGHCGGKAHVASADGEKAPCHGGKAKLTSAEGHEGCPIKRRVDAILTSLPSMQYKVGEETMGCPKAAAKLAEANGGKIVYVVGDESYTDEGEAMAQLAKVLEEKIDSMTVMQFAVGDDCVRCPMTAKSLAKKADKKVMYRVGGFDFDTQEKAEQALAAVKTAVDGVKMSYKVGETTTGCSETAGKLAKENGGKMVYVVGEEETPCPKTAQLKLDQAKVQAIVEAAAGIAAS